MLLLSCLSSNIEGLAPRLLAMIYQLSSNSEKDVTVFNSQSIRYEVARTTTFRVFFSGKSNLLELMQFQFRNSFLTLISSYIHWLKKIRSFWFNLAALQNVLCMSITGCSVKKNFSNFSNLLFSWYLSNFLYVLNQYKSW